MYFMISVKSGEFEDFHLRFDSLNMRKFIWSLSCYINWKGQMPSLDLILNVGTFDVWR